MNQFSSPSVHFRPLAHAILAWCLFGSAASLMADEPGGSSPKPRECRFTEWPITIDGKALDKAWETAEVIDQFQIPWSQKKTTPAQAATRARLLWDRDYLYFFAEMDDSDLFANVAEPDGDTWTDDVFELFFKPADDKPGYYEFEINARNTVFDLFLPARGDVEPHRRTHDFHVDSKVVLKGTLNDRNDRDQGWSVEGKIAWRDFFKTGGRPAVDEVWKFVLCRYDYNVARSTPELSWSSPNGSTPSPDFHHWEDYVPLRFIGPENSVAHRKRGIETLPPLTTSNVVGSPEPPLPYKTRVAYPKLRLNQPVFATRIPGTDQILAGLQPKSGSSFTVVRFHDHPEVDSTTPVLELPGFLAYNITFHPRFAENGYLYVGASGPSSPGFVPQSEERFKLFKKNSCRVTRYRMDTKTLELDPNSAAIIIEWESDGHNGADVVFGNDGMLYVTSGDGTSDSDMIESGQGIDHLLAKLMRIDVDHPDPGRMYSVPKDNPFVTLEGARPEVWAYGFRNPWRLTSDPITGDIWVGNNGQDLWEQAYRVEKGANYGWSVMEGSYPFYPDRKRGPTPIMKPTVEHSHREARSLTGGVVYHGTKLPELQGAYIYGDHSTGKVWGVKHDGKQITFHKELVDTQFRITHFCLDSQGEIMVLDYQGDEKGNLYHLEPNTVPASASEKFPRKLSQSGLFASVKAHVLQPGIIPYSVNAPLWSDGSHKERWIAIPHDPDRKSPPIDTSTSHGWNFPDNTVLIKSFALEKEAGVPESRRWIETRFMLKTEGEWFGYSYEWNEEQTDAVLVSLEGKDRDFEIRDTQSASGIRTQHWRYPGRTECMVCHSRAANYVLGLSTLQFNRDHDYGGIVDNQLLVLEHLGLAKLSGWETENLALIRRELEAKGLSEKELSDAIQNQTATSGQRTAPKSTLLAMNPDSMPHLVNPYDKKNDLTTRARSYLHSNCANCHTSAGGGNAQIQLEFLTPLDKAKLIDEVPLHHKFNLTDARIIAPGAPERSVLLTRLAMRGPGQMPQLATSIVDQQALELFREWIASLPPAEKKTTASSD